MEMVSAKIKDASGLIKIQEWKYVIKIQGWKWGHQTLKDVRESSKFKDEEGVIKI